VTFKANWEKTSVLHHLEEGVIEHMVHMAFPNKKLNFHEVLSGGLANINVKIQLAKDSHPLILRVYLREKQACYREQKIGKLLKGQIPAPQVFHIDEIQGYCFAVTEFMPGIHLRDLLLRILPHEMAPVMYEVGSVLSKITTYEFPKSGFFDRDLNIAFELADDFPLHCAKKCLQDAHVSSVLGKETVSQIEKCLNAYGHLLQDDKAKHLVHADFDPSNILVDKIDGMWKVSGVLDWEFAFSGSLLCDVANMLRYAHKMPAEFQDAFLKGLKNGGVILQKDWHIVVQMLNLLSLLDLLKRSDLQNHPNRCADVCDLLYHILKTLKEPTHADDNI
jgi:Ser/Thr protein kinase RdoA (MazF antagonist)